MSDPYDTILRESEFWTSEQYVDVADFPAATRTELTGPFEAPVIDRIRREDDRIWRPPDYNLLPTRVRPGLGYTLIRDAYITYPGMVLAPDGRFVEDMFTWLNPGRLSTPLERDLKAGPAARSGWAEADQPIDKAILISGPGVNRFGHQLLDFLPAFGVLEEFDVFPDWPLLIPANVPSWVLSLIGAFSKSPVAERRRRRLWRRGSRSVREVKRFSQHECFKTRVRHLCVPWTVRQPAFHPRVASVFDRVCRRCADGGHPIRSPRRVFIARDAAEDRRMTNAEDARELLEASGFQTVAPERMPFRDQVGLFAGVECVVGEAGSGLHGAVFSSRESVCVELRPSTYHVHGQTAIAALREQTFTSVKGSQGSSRPMSREHWTLDLPALRERLSSVGL